MPNTPVLSAEKPTTFGMDKFLGPVSAEEKPTSILEWAAVYYQIKVSGAPEKTEAAKKRDLNMFLMFFLDETGNEHIDSWTPSLSRRFATFLQKAISPATSRPYAPASINRTLATVRHFGRWLNQQRPLMAGYPLEGVKEVQEDAPDWNGLTERQITRCKSAIDQRIKACTRADQNPQMEAAVFYMLYHTGLRESELVGLTVDQYHHKGLHQVYRRKGKRYTKKVPLPSEARDYLDRYLKDRQATENEALFLTRSGNPLKEQDVRNICLRISNQACAQLGPEEHFKANPHMLRHTFLKRAADKKGMHFAHDLSGNVSMREVFHYTRPSQDEKDEAVETLME